MSAGGLFGRLTGVGRFLRQRGFLGIARRAVGRRLRRPVSAALRREFPNLSQLEAQTLVRIGFESRLAAERLEGIRVRRPLQESDIPIVPSITEDPLFGDRFQSTVTFEWFDEETGLTGFDTIRVGTADIPTVESIKAEIDRMIEDRLVNNTDLLRLEDTGGVEVEINTIESITRGF